MKKIPNILTTTRVFLALILLLFFDKVDTFFVLIFIIAMLTDLLDGKIARWLKVSSDTGALLDSIADFLLDACIIKIVFRMKIMKNYLTVWLFAALGIGLISPIINYIKHKKVFFVHSILCKACMCLLFGVPFAIIWGFAEQYIVITLTLITLAMIELVIMSFAMDEPDPDAKGIYYLINHKNSHNT